ncbi:hypothetical protein LEMLEM_LOCUS11064, partial [Lemmus lemmus]
MLPHSYDKLQRYTPSVNGCITLWINHIKRTDEILPLQGVLSMSYDITV